MTAKILPFKIRKRKNAGTPCPSEDFIRRVAENKSGANDIWRIHLLASCKEFAWSTIALTLGRHDAKRDEFGAVDCYVTLTPAKASRLVSLIDSGMMWDIEIGAQLNVR